MFDDEMLQLSSHMLKKDEQEEPGLEYRALLFTDAMDGSDVTIYQV